MTDTSDDNITNMTDPTKAPLEYELPEPPATQDEEDVCRVCRLEGDEEMPLIYPCKCSGSVRYVHPDCLKQWLATSGKRACEICDHKYVFTKVYSDYIPSTIPFEVVLRQIARVTFRILYRIFRVYLASNAWLLVLPSANMYTLHCLLWAVDTASPRPKPSSSSSVVANETMPDNSTHVSTSPLDETRIAVHEIINHPFRTMGTIVQDSWTRWNAGEPNTIFGYVFRGQVLSIALAAVVISIILIREWMTQHNWDLHTPKPETEEGPIDPSRWTFKNGVAYPVTSTPPRPATSPAPASGSALELARERVRAVIGTDKCMNITIADVETLVKSDTELADALKSKGIETDFSSFDKVKSVGELMTEHIGDIMMQYRLRATLSTIRDLPGYLTPKGEEATPEAVADGDDDADEWEDEGDGPSLVATGPGPSTQPARPCNADKEGFEKEVSYAAPELINAGPSLKGKEKATDQGQENSGPTDEDAAGPSENVNPETPQAGASNANQLARSTSSTSAVHPSDLSRNHSFSTQPSQSETHSEVVEPSPPAQPVELPNVDNPNPAEQALVNMVQQAVAEGDAPAPAPVIQVAPPADRPADLDDPDDQPLDIDDWEGILEVAGLIGPLQNLIQNVMFGFMIMGASLFLLVGGPMWIGRLFLAIDYIRTSIYLSTLVFKGSRVIFDPVFRITHDIMKEVVVLPALSSLGAFEKILADSAGLGSTTLPKLDWIPSSVREEGASKLGDFFATIGHWTHDQAVTLHSANRQWSARVLASDSLASRLTTIAVGYAVVAGTMGLLALNPAGTSSKAGEAILQSVKRHSQFVKLSFFMFIELAVFPSGIGFVILSCCTPLVPDWGFEELKAFVRDVPFGAMFTCWIVGTTFMFWFAAVLQEIRKRVRKGVLFFIRDPNERTYNPVREILERPTSSQVRKLGISAVMYIFVVCHLFGAWCWILGRGPLKGFNVLPLRLNSYNALSTAPFDLLALSMLTSPSVTTMFPWTAARRQLESWWRSTIKLYNLSTPLRYATSVQPESVAATRIWAVLDVIDQVVLGRYQNSTCKARVPASDGIVLLRPEERKGRGVFVRLDENGAPTTEEDKMMLLRQDKAAREKRRDPKKDYTVVWLPQYWRTRVHALIMTTLVTAGLLACAALIGPVIAGRLMLDRILPHPAHDGYNWAAGACVWWCLMSIGLQVKKYIIASQRAERIRASTAATRVKRLAVSVLRAMGSFTILFLLLPMLVGITWELYVAMPIRYGFSPATPVLHIWEAWAMGMVLTFAYVAVMHDVDHNHGIPVRLVRTGGPRRFRALYRVLRLHRLELNWSLTWPIMVRLCVAITAPSIISILPARLNSNEREEHAFSVIYRFTYPVCLVVYLLVAYSHLIARRYRLIRQDLIDAEYVIEERVENYDTQAKEKGELRSSQDAEGDESPKMELAEGDESEDQWEDVED